jgi:hypothetical protein
MQGVLLLIVIAAPIAVLLRFIRRRP